MNLFQTFLVEKGNSSKILFPTPLEDSFYITTICRESDLVSWSKRQHNCIRSYTSAVKSKQRYFYKIIYGKEEATLELKLANGYIRKGDLLGISNISVTAGLEEMVKVWLKEQKYNKKKLKINEV